MVAENIGQSGCHKWVRLRKTIKFMIEMAGSGHYASSMSALEIMYPLFYEQGVKPDEFILSKGHAAPALYAILHDLGYLSEKQLACFRQYDGLPGHPEIGINGVLCSSGSLGMGISKAIGLAYANPKKTYHVLVGDGELQEGQNWEALFHIARNGIENVIIHVDANGMQYSGKILEKVPELGFDWLIIHKTLWNESNKYLTRPQNPRYAEIVEKYSQKLLEMMRENEKIVVLNADLEQDFGLTKIKEAFPERFIECGISEQHMVSMANGLALAGKLPVCHTFGAFYRRAIDQIYNNECDHLKIIYVAGLCGDHKQNVGKSHNENHLDELFITQFDMPDFDVFSAEDIDDMQEVINESKKSILVSLVM